MNSTLTAGKYYLVVQADAAGAVNESDLTTQTNSTAITLSAPPPPDLSTGSVTSSLTVGQPGQSETVSWEVQNIGGSAATGPWVDDVYLSPDGTITSATLLASQTESGGLAAGASTMPGSPPRSPAASPTAATR